MVSWSNHPLLRRRGKVNPHRVVVAWRVPGPAPRLLVVSVADVPAVVAWVAAFRTRGCVSPGVGVLAVTLRHHEVGGAGRQAASAPGAGVGRIRPRRAAGVSPGERRQRRGRRAAAAPASVGEELLNWYRLLRQNKAPGWVFPIGGIDPALSLPCLCRAASPRHEAGPNHLGERGEPRLALTTVRPCSLDAIVV